MAVVLTRVAVSVTLWVLLWVSVCVLAGALKFPCVSYHYCWFSRRIYYILHAQWQCVSCRKKMLSVICSKHLSVLVAARIGKIKSFPMSCGCGVLLSVAIFSVMRDYPWRTNGSLRSLSHCSWILCFGVVCRVQSARSSW